MSDNPDIKGGDNSAGIAGERLRAIVERIERAEEDKAEIMADIREIYAEAKGAGFDTKALRKIIALRKKDAEEAREEQELLEIYAHALGMGVFG